MSAIQITNCRNFFTNLISNNMDNEEAIFQVSREFDMTMSEVESVVDPDASL